jgi:formylglycine-generating enzyme
MAALLGAAGMAQAAVFVTIGDLGNTADGTYGKVDYEYQISATEVTIAEFIASGVGDGDENYWNDGTRTVGAAAPASYVSLYEAKKYANYLTEQANGGLTNYNLYSADGTGTGSYTRADAISDNILVYGVPTEDEWYKAAYYTGNAGDPWSLYANGTDTDPTKGTTNGWNYDFFKRSPNYTWTAGYGGEEQNGTYDMMGNVWEWTEDSSGVIRGGAYGNDGEYLRSSVRISSFDPTTENGPIGFRVAAIPEPATMGLLAIFGLVTVGYRRLLQAIGN